MVESTGEMVMWTLEMYVVFVWSGIRLSYIDKFWTN